MLDAGTKVAIRRHLGAPAACSPAAPIGRLLGPVRNQALENAMNALTIDEEALILGQPYGLLSIYDPVTPGDSINVTVTVGLLNLAYSALVGPSDRAQSVAQRLTSALSPALGSSGFVVATPSGTQAVPGTGTVAMRCAAGTFTLAADVTRVGGAPATDIVVTADGGSYPDPSYTTDNTFGGTTIVAGLIPVCDALESQLLGSAPNVSFGRVGSNRIGGAEYDYAELARRNELLQRYRRDLGALLGLAVGAA